MPVVVAGCAKTLKSTRLKIYGKGVFVIPSTVALWAVFEKQLISLLPCFCAHERCKIENIF
jgi:hypothetical protein